MNAALEALGGKWNRKAKSHLFERDPADAIDQVAVDGAFTDKRRELDQFFTPPELAKRIVAAADVAGRWVLEPSAGRGALIMEALAQHAKHACWVEKDLACDDECRCLAHDGYLGDFLTVASRLPPVERVVMNPPFSRQQDIAHVTKAWGLLASGGILVAIMSAGVTFRGDRKTTAFRDLVRDSLGTFSMLPEHSFRESGTDVNAVVVTMRRR